jgi:hypothetical protein
MTYVARVTGIALSVAGLLGYGLAVCVRQCHSRPVLCCQQFLTHGAPLTGRNSPWNAHRAPPRLEALFPTTIRSGTDGHPGHDRFTPFARSA